MDSGLPIVKLDKLGRKIYTKNSSTNEVFIDYWGDSQSVKIIYRVYGGDVVINAYDTKNSNILEISDRLYIDLPDFNLSRQNFYFGVKESIFEQWDKKLMVEL